MKKLLYIYNPHSGRGQVRVVLSQIIDIFANKGYEVTTCATTGKDFAKDKVREEAGAYDLVVCSGGDGTLDEVVTGMMQRENRVPIGYIPTGSTNDFAHTLKIPRNNMLKAAEIAVGGKPYPCDVGAFNDDYFVYVAAFGLFSDVSYQTPQNMKHVFGHVAYILEGAKRLQDIPSYHMLVRTDDRQIQDDFVYGMISNSDYVGGLKNTMDRGISLNDGVFEVSLIRRPTNPIMWQEVVAALMMPRLLPSDHIYTFKTSHIEIFSTKEVPWSLDGEFGGDHDHVVIDNRFREITFMVGEDVIESMNSPMPDIF
ncbi:MAG: diacylglycerol kinase family lipid kinase [Lachnospiraceae bacterium]|nr:diacylglycerol kinase family lipid kinase [Lachnospiraceae bacterium]